MRLEEWPAQREGFADPFLNDLNFGCATKTSGESGNSITGYQQPPPAAASVLQ
jgi:hypothetical protein